MQNLNVLIKLCQTCSYVSTLILHRIAKMKYYVYQTAAQKVIALFKWYSVKSLNSCVNYTNEKKNLGCKILMFWSSYVKYVLIFRHLYYTVLQKWNSMFITRQHKKLLHFSNGTPLSTWIKKRVEFWVQNLTNLIQFGSDQSQQSFQTVSTNQRPGYIPPVR